MKSEPLFLGIDLGTSVFKAGVYTCRGELIGLGTSELNLDMQETESGRFELATRSFWNHLRKCISAALDKCPKGNVEIAGLSYASQANTFVLLDKQDQVLSPMIMWPDRRGERYMDQIRFRWKSDDLRNLLGMEQFTPEMLGFKCRWFQEEAPLIWSQCDKIQTITEYFVYSLTGERVGDYGTSALLGLWDQRENRWWQEGLDVFGIPERALSRPLQPGSFAGRTTNAATRFVGLPAGVPLYVGSLDHHVGGIVPLNTFEAEVSLSLGTVVAAICTSEKFSPRQNVITGPDFRRGQFYQLSYSKFGVSWIKRLKDQVATGISWEDFLAEGAAQIKKLDGRVQVAVEESLRENRFIFSGVNATDTRGVFTAVVLTAISEEIRTLVESLLGDRKPRVVGICGGGTRNPLWELLLKDILKTKVISVPGTEFGCLGAALLAMAGVEDRPVAEIAKSIQFKAF